MAENCGVKDITEEDTFKLLKFLKRNNPVLWKSVPGSKNRALKLQLKEKLVEHLDNKYSLEIVDRKIHNLRTLYRRPIKKAQKDEPISNEEDIEVEKCSFSAVGNQEKSNATKIAKSKTKIQWKFYYAMLFIKNDRKENREEELSKQEKSTLIEFYKLIPSLWNTSLIKEYRDCDL